MTVAQIITILKDTDKLDLITPQILANYLIFLSASINEAGMNVLKCEQAYHVKWVEVRKETTTDKQAEMSLKATSEYLEWQKARYAEKTLINVIQSVKKVLAVKNDEAKNQY